MKTPCPGIRAAVMLCVTLALCACSASVTQSVAGNDVPYTSAEMPVSDMPAAMSLMQPQAVYADLAEQRHYSAYSAFHAMQSSGGSGGAASNTPPAACFGNQ